MTGCRRWWTILFIVRVAVIAATSTPAALAIHSVKLTDTAPEVPLPGPRDHAVAAANGKIYAFGGAEH
jgi:hypothetical protein